MEFTDELRKKGQEARKAKIAAGAHFKRDWLDSDLWDELARNHGIRLPQWHVAPTAGKLNSWAKRLGKEPISVIWGASGKRIIALNPHQPLRAFVGQLLEP